MVADTAYLREAGSREMQKGLEPQAPLQGSPQGPSTPTRPRPLELPPPPRLGTKTLALGPWGH